MRALFRTGLAAIVTSALALSGCGGSSPSSPSGKGVVLQGTVLSSASGVGGVGVEAHSGAASASGKMIVTVRENPAISATVSANGTFELEGLPAGTITLDFTIDGKLVGTITITGVSTDAEVKIVVQVTADGVILIQITIDDHDGEDTPGTPGTPPSPNACLIEGGRPGSNIELEGSVASGTSSLFKLDVQGNRAGVLVDVNSASASWKCVGQSGSDCKGTFKAGNQVHVRGLLTTCTTTSALVNATEVKVQKP
jgi:hypothetical protein